jgi:MFS family permease
MRLTLRSTLANRGIALVEGAWAAASLGTWSFTILLALYAYERGGTGAIGLAVLVRMLPAGVAAPYAALLADAHSRRAVLLVSTAARALLAAAIAVATGAEAPLSVVLVLAALLTVAGTAHKPAQAALLPGLARTPAELAAANVCWSAIDYAGFLAGSVLVGVLAGAAGLGVAFAATAAAFAIAAAFVLVLPADPAPAALEEEHAYGRITEGFRTVWRDRRLRLLAGVFGADALTQAMTDVLLVVAALQVLDIGQGGAGWLSAAWGVGGLAGGAAATTLLGRGRLASGLLAGCLLAGVPLVVIGAWPGTAATLVLLVVLGVGYGLVEVALLTLTQRLAAADVLGRVFGVQETLFVAATAIGSLLAAALVGLLGAEAAIAVTGLVLPVLAVAVRRPLRSCEDAAHVPGEAFRLLRGVHVFAPLPIASIENLAVHAETQRFAAGERIIVEGEAGDRFYVIVDGGVEVSVNGAVRRQEGPGEYFGEIALLRDTTRTATVVATVAVTALTLEREEFLAAVGAHVRSSREVEAVAADRLATASTGLSRRRG